MAIVGSGYDRDVGGAQGSGYTGGSFPYLPEYASAGVSIEKWMSWSDATQRTWLQEYNRTDAQQNYYKDSDYAKTFYMKEWFDDNVLDPAKDFSVKGLETTKDTITLAIILGGLYLALR